MCLVSMPWSPAIIISVKTFGDLFVLHFFLDLLVRPSKAEVFQLDGGGVLLVWRPVQSSDPVTYCVQYSTDGGFQITKHFQMNVHA